MSDAKFSVLEKDPRGAWLSTNNYTLGVVDEKTLKPYVIVYGGDFKSPLIAISVRDDGDFDVQFSGHNFPSTVKVAKLSEVIRVAEEAGLAHRCDCPLHNLGKSDN